MPLLQMDMPTPPIVDEQQIPILAGNQARRGEGEPRLDIGVHAKGGEQHLGELFHVVVDAHIGDHGFFRHRNLR